MIATPKSDGRPLRTAGAPVYSGLLHKLDPAIVMSASGMVDAALSGFDQGEVVTIPSLAAIDLIAIK